jgi:hypothetical protein
MSNVDHPKPADTEPAPPPSGVPIAAGHAREALLLSMADVAAAIGRLESVAVAIARALDESAVQS